MEVNLYLQLHVHSDRSHDSNVPIKKYVNFLERSLQRNTYAVIGITDHNVVPISCEDALELSTDKILVIPGIQWKIHKTLSEALTKLSTRREIITLGNHDNLRNFILNNTKYRILDNDEIFGNFTEQELIDYLLVNKEIVIIIPHPRHLFIDYYGWREIKKLIVKLKNSLILNYFFVEEKTGYDPFVRLFHCYRYNYQITGGSDAHEISSFLGTISLFSVITLIPVNDILIDNWHKAIINHDIPLYQETIRQFFDTLAVNNKNIVIKKYYFRSLVHFLSSIPRWFKRRIDDFPNNLFK